MMRLEEAKRRFFVYQEGQNHSAKQLDHYRHTFKDFGKFVARKPKDVSILTSETLQGYVAHLKATPLERPYRGTTARSIVGIAGQLKDLRAFVNWCRAEGIIEWEVKVPKPRVPDTFFPVLTDDELKRVWGSKRLVGKSEFQIRNRAMIALFLDTGIRLAELAGLAPADVLGSGSRRFLKVLGKGGKERLVPFTPPVGALVDEWLRVRGGLASDRPTLFLIEPRGIQMLIRRIWLETGVHLFAHKIRHSAATNMITAGADAFTVQEILGHTSITTTRRYISMSPERISEKHAAASPFLRLLDSIDVPEQAAPRRMLKR